MKRGNTALKRVVSVASVAAMAIAGAVLAAPAASALTVATSGVRATPIANAPFINDDGADNALITKIGEFDATNKYGAPGTAADQLVSTGAVPTVGVADSQSVSGFQLFIPVKNGGAFSAGDTITVPLTGGAEFAGTPNVDISRTPVLSASNLAATPKQYGLDTVAGWAGANLFSSPRATDATTALDGATTAVASLSANKAQRVSAKVESNKTTLTITLGQNDPNNAAAITDQVSATGAPGYLVTVSNVAVSTKNVTAPAAIVVGDGTDTTTIGYVSPFNITAATDSGYVVQKNGDVELPAITIAEAVKDAFVSGTGVSFDLSASGDAQEKVPAPTVEFADAGTASTVNAKAVGTSVTTGVLTVDVPATATDVTDVNKAESTTVSGASVSGLKAGSDLTVSVAGTETPTETILGTLKSYTASQDSIATLTIKQDSSAPRIAGTNRYATAGDIAAKFGTVTAVVLANGLDAKQGADALSSNFLAGAKGAPILLTDSSDNLPQATQDALVKVLKGSAGADSTVTLYVLGATDSVSAAAVTKAEFIAKAAVNSGVTVKTVRLDGANRYETSAKVVTEAKDKIGSYNMGKGTLNTAFLASGTTNADALAAGSLSAGAGLPVLLTDGTALDDSVAKVIKDNDIKQIIILGGTDRISADLAKALSDVNGATNVVRVAGDDRYETAADLNTLALKGPADGGLSQSLGGTAYLANGSTGFPDALAVGPLAGQNSDALLTVPVKDLPKSTSDFLSATANKAAIDWIEALGSTDRISDELVAAAQKAIGF